MQKFSNKVLSIGCHCDPPKGGVAYVLKAYQDYIFRPFKFVANSKGGKIRNLWYFFKSYIQCEWLYLIDKDIEIVHIHTASYISFHRSCWFINQAKRYHKKVIAHVHGGGFKDFHKESHTFVEKNLHKVDGIIALSETWKDFFISIGCKKVYVINNIIEPPKNLPKKSDGKFHFLFLGLITEAKGIFDLLEVFESNQEAWKEKIVLHIGGRGKIDKLMSLVNEKKLSNIVQYEGWVSGLKKQELFNKADAFILPSYAEGVPISILEAMSYGLPVFASAVGGIPDMIKDGKNGWLFEAGDMQTMANDINIFLSSTSNYEKISTANRELAKNYMPEFVSQKLEELYGELLS